ncbi:MAG TPA: hypothetical protein VH417_07055 [Vicinamibacterales bacterium]
MTKGLINEAAATRVAPPHRRVDVPRDVRSTPELHRERQPSPDLDQVLDDSFPASDPPSWTGAISRVAGISDADRRNEQLVRRIRAEFLEMPGLCLTSAQAQRLWSLGPRTCEALLRSLTDARFLRRTKRGLFVLYAPRRYGARSEHRALSKRRA